jgi:Yip1-like protein
MELPTRIINLLTNPHDEWKAIAAEATDITSLYQEYFGLLAIIPALCTFLGLCVVGVRVPFLGLTVRTPIAEGMIHLIVWYICSLASVYLSAVIIEKLAPSFQSRGDTLQAVKLVGFAATPVWLAGVFSLVPSLSLLSLIAGLYAIYLFYVGVRVVMQTPAEKVLAYMVVAGLVVMVVHVVAFSVAGSVFITSAVTVPTLSLEQLLRESGAIGKI